MTTKPHHKHPKLTKPLGGQLHRYEVALIGAPCGVIQQLAADLAKALTPLRVGYLDAAHGAAQSPKVFWRETTDQIGHFRADYHEPHAEWSLRTAFADCDLVLVNGNHFRAAQQLVLIHPAKRDSLERKLDRLTQVMGCIGCEGEAEPYDFLTESFTNLDDKPFWTLEQVSELANHLRNWASPPKIRGLVLAGGQSQRMGQDKGLIDYHGMPQRDYLAQMLLAYCQTASLSLREPDELANWEVVADRFVGLGPFGAVLSALMHDPNSAWLTVATDMPLVDGTLIQRLIAGRNPSKLATCFHNPETGFPEPLLTIWEPRAYPRMLQFLAQGHSCPRKVLINSEIEELTLSDDLPIRNANTPEEMAQLKARIDG